MHDIDQGLPHFIESIRNQYPTASEHQITTAHQRCYHEWQAQNTHVLFIVDASITLKGPYLEADLRLIEQSFHLGDLRDGVGYLLWMRSGCAASSLSIR